MPFVSAQEPENHSLNSTIRLNQTLTEFPDKRSDIGIALAESCIELNKLHEWTCPRYTQFMHLDTTNANVSGPLVWNGQDVYRESIPHIKNPYRFYDFVHTDMVVVDPPANHYDYLSFILVVPQVPPYAYHVNGTHMIGFDAFVDESCREATIAASIAYNQTKFYELIEHIKGNCTDDWQSQFQFPRDLSLKHEYDPLTSPHYIYKLWVEEQKQRCKNKC